MWLLTYWLTYLLTPLSRDLLEKLSAFQTVKKFPAFYETRRFITAVKSVRHLSLSWASPIHSIPLHPNYWRSILILSSHLRLGLPSGLLPLGFHTKNLYTPFHSPIRATCSAHLILLGFITRTILGADYRSLSSSLCSFLHSPVISSLLGPNILLSTLFSNTFRLRSSFIVSDQVSHPYKITSRVSMWCLVKIPLLVLDIEYIAFDGLVVSLVFIPTEFMVLKNRWPVFDVVLWQYTAFLMITSVFIGFIGLYATLMCVACSQLEKLRANISLIGNRGLNRMQGSADCPASEGMLEELKGCIRHHQEIMMYVQTVNTVTISHFPYICF